MCCDELFKNMQKFFIKFCNGITHSFDDEDDYYYENKKKDIEEPMKINHCIINMDEKSTKNFISYEQDKREDEEWENLS